jgi:hypothetical protein
MEARVTGHHLPAAAGSGITFKNDGDFFLDTLKH